MVLHEDSVEENGDVGGSFQGAVQVEDWRLPHDIVALPFAGLAVWIDEGNSLLVNAARLAVDIGLVVVGIEDLQFIAVVAGAGRGEKDPAVAARLIAAGDICWDAPLDVELIIFEFTPGFDVVDGRGFAYGQNAVGDVPPGWGLISVRHPFVNIFSIE